jgi:PAS domain S-box-containing protein
MINFSPDDIFQSMYAGLLVSDVDGRIVYFNAAAELIDGVKAEGVTGRQVDEVFPGTGVPEVLRLGRPQLNQPCPFLWLLARRVDWAVCK